jgi:hypothetical protein
MCYPCPETAPGDGSGFGGAVRGRPEDWPGCGAPGFPGDAGVAAGGGALAQNLENGLLLCGAVFRAVF